MNLLLNNKKFVILSIILSLITICLNSGYLSIKAAVVIPMIFIFTYCALIDNKYKIIPAKSIFIGLGVGVFSFILYLFNQNDWFYKSHFSPLVGFLVLPGMMFIYSLLIEKITQNEAIGMGDIKAFAVIGFTVGFDVQLIAFLIAGLLFIIFSFIEGIKYKNFKIEIPMGPYILTGLIAALIFHSI